MAQRSEPCLGSALLYLAAGAAVGALAVALATPRSGPDLRDVLRRLGRRARRRTAGLAEDARATWEGLQGRADAAARDLSRGVADAVDDLGG
jgi:gas vesicle protein